VIVVLGASGYFGEAFIRQLAATGKPYRALSRRELDYSKFQLLLNFLKETKPELVVNAAGFTGRPNVDACETQRAETLLGSVVLGQTVASACELAGVTWMQLSSGCIYNGAFVKGPDGWKLETDLTKPEIRNLVETQPDLVAGFKEMDDPNFSFRRPPCSFYSGSKALAEEVLSQFGNGYIVRPRIPFDEYDNARNYLSKIQRYAKVYDNVNAVSHRGDFAWACLELWNRRAPSGTYNVTNPGFVTTRQVVAKMKKALKLEREFEFFSGDSDFYKVAKAPRSNCLMDVSKLLSTGIKMRSVDEALEDAFRNWKPEVKG